jgi:hypothetical protein
VLMAMLGVLHGSPTCKFLRRGEIAMHMRASRKLQDGSSPAILESLALVAAIASLNGCRHHKHRVPQAEDSARCFPHHRRLLLQQPGEIAMRVFLGSIPDSVSPVTSIRQELR